MLCRCLLGDHSVTTSDTLEAHFNKPLLFNHPYHKQRTQSPIRPLRNRKKDNNRPKGVLLCISSPVVIDRKDRPRGAEDGFSFIAARGCSVYPILKRQREEGNCFWGIEAMAK